MATPKKKNKRIYINTELTGERVDDYWQTLNMSRDTWMSLSQAQRYELALNDLLDKIAGTRDAREIVSDEDE